MADIEIVDSMHCVGTHVGKRDGKLSGSIRAVIEMKFGPTTAMQTYIKNPHGSAPPSIDMKDLAISKRLLVNNDIYFVIHGALIYNMCGSVDPTDGKVEQNLDKVYKSLIGELDIGAYLGGGVVIHMGTCKDYEYGLKKMQESIDIVLTRIYPSTRMFAEEEGITPEEFVKKRKLILENSSHEGTKLGYTIQGIADIIEGVNEELKEQVKVCIDTAHAYAAGSYSLSTQEEIDRFYSEFDECIGIDKLELFHLNDTRISKQKAKNAFYGSKKDRHEYLGQGHMFKENNEGLIYFMNSARSRNKPVICEPPKVMEDGSKGWGSKRNIDILVDIMNDSDYPILIPG